MAEINLDRGYLPARKVWDRYGVTSMTLHRWIKDPDNDFPNPVYFGRFRYWSIAEIEEWERKQESRSQAGRKSEKAELVAASMAKVEALSGSKPEARSRKTNGSTAFLGKVDGRSINARRYRDVVADLTNEMGGNLSIIQNVKVAQAASLIVRSEQLQAQIANGDPDIDDEDLVRVANALRRELITLGLTDDDT